MLAFVDETFYQMSLAIQPPIVFSLCFGALRRSVKLIVYTWNRRQLYRQKYPQYTPYPMEFLYH